MTTNKAPELCWWCQGHEYASSTRYTRDWVPCVVCADRKRIAELEAHVESLVQRLDYAHRQEENAAASVFASADKIAELEARVKELSEFIETHTGHARDCKIHTYPDDTIPCDCGHTKAREGLGL